ncbi:hypothetical protein PGT21_020315 [Puccinia graminis f. sp. tritici]|uniref:Uncharacterized protein n=1 Tax=Puccinia graminis f. sp. tritici TaxID=56615 RepID=A0A5B0P1H6_PUCGR|nr:hypothetical protein PGTUg99_031620 [Puccinia graminis f. sp. tritici]KAA1099781.1 hypothetical protein PGT21_020315 [Puccinia graminis f. sp. tritici]
MSSEIHRASVFSHLPGQASAKRITAESKKLSTVPKSGKACGTLDMNQLSPPVSKQAPPSPPTSTPTHAPPASPRKRKSVIFNDAPLRSARSVPNHRSRAQTIATIPRATTKIQHPGPVQPTLFSSRSYADQQKRARLSLAAPQLANPTSPSTSRNREADLRRLQAPGSPLGAKAEARKKLARFYYNPSFLQELPRRPKSPTLATSAGSKQAARRHSHQMLTVKDEARLDSSDESSDSDDEVALALINDTFDIRRTSSCSRLQNLRNELDDEPDEEPSELRPILKKTRAQILLAETVQQATAENGRPRLSLDPTPLSAYRRVIAAVTSKASQKTNSSLPGDASSSTLPADAAESSEPNSSIRSLQINSEASISHPQSSSTVDIDWNADSLASHGTNLSLENGNLDSVDSDAIEACLLSSARSCLVTLQASLLPPPDEMRLDPVSPLAKLTSPQKYKLSKLGTLDGSPREPRGVLPRAPTCNPRLDLPKNQPRTRGRSLFRARPKPAESRSTPTTPSVTSGLLRTPDSSPVRQSQSLPQVTITLREVEDAYISLYDHLDALVKHWQESSQPSDEDQQLRLGSLFADDVGAALMKCLVREVENLCRHDESTSAEPQATSSSNSAASHLRDEISRMILPSNANPLSLNGAPTPSTATINKSGASTNEIRRRVAEIETGQAALRCIAILWGWPSCMVHFEDSYTQRLLSLLIQIPKSSILRRKKNLIAVGLMNHTFKHQRLKRATLEPHVSNVVDAIASTLYLSAGKSGDKGQKVLCLGLSALQQLTTQVPQHIAPKVGKFLEPFLASLMAPDSPILRHQAIGGLGALINCTKLDWDLPAKTSARVQIHEMRASADALLKLQQGRKEAFKEKLSTFALAFYNDKNTFLRWHLLVKQIKRSLKEGDVGWVISVMATMIALLGKRIRKLDPPMTRVFMPVINHLLGDSRTNHLTSQLWDYYIYVMLHWSIDHRTHNSEQVWALDPMQRPFFLQLLRSTYCVPIKTSSSPEATSSKAPPSTTDIPNQYKGLLQPSKDLTGTEPQINPVVSDTNPSSTVVSEKPQCRPLDGPHSSSHHILLSAYLYGVIGFIKEFLAHPPMCFSPPSELLATTNTCSRFQNLDTVWDEMIGPILPNILAGPHDEHRYHVYEILIALCKHDSPDSPTENEWTLERLIHPAYHQLPTKPESSLETYLEQFSNAAVSTAVTPVEIPALDPLWICSRYEKVLPIIVSSISSIQYIQSVEKEQWVTHPSTGSPRPEDSKRVGPRRMFRLWQEFVKSMGSVYQSCDWIFDTPLSASLCALGDTLEKTIQVPAPLVLRAESEPHHSPNISIFLFRNLYSILKRGIGIELMNRKLIVINDSASPDKPRKISLYFKILSFVLASSVAGEIANTVGPEDWAEYDALAQVVIDDYISAQKVMGCNEKLYDLISDLSDVLQACTHDRLTLLFGKISMKIVIELMKIVEPGVLLDEPSLKPASAMMIDACFNSIQAGGVIDQATQKQFIEVFNEFFSRLTQESLKILLDSCQTNFSAYLNNEQNDDRQLVYNTLLSKLRKVDLTLLMAPLELSALILSPFRNQPSSSTFSSKGFIDFVKTSAHAYIGEQQDIVQAIKNLTSVSPPPVTPLKAAADSFSSASLMGPNNGTEAPSSTPEATAGVDHSNSVHEHIPDHSSVPAESCNSLTESQISSSSRKKSKKGTVRGSRRSQRLQISIDPESLDKSDAQVEVQTPVSEPLDSSLDHQVQSPVQEDSASQGQAAESAEISENAVIQQSQGTELTLPDKPADSAGLPKTSNTRAVDGPETDHQETDHSETDHSETDHSETDHQETDHLETPKSIEALQIQPSQSNISSLSQAKSLPVPSEARLRNDCFLPQVDPRLLAESPHKAPCFTRTPLSKRPVAGPDETTKAPADCSLQSNGLDVRDPTLFGPLASRRSSGAVHDFASLRLVHKSVKETDSFPSPSSELGDVPVWMHVSVAQNAQQLKDLLDPTLPDSKEPVNRFVEQAKLSFHLERSLSDQSALAPSLPLQPNSKNLKSISQVNQGLRSSIIPSSCPASFTQPYTPKAFFAPSEAPDHRISPITTSLGALDTLAPFAKRQAGKCLSFGPQQSATLEPAQSAREMLQNMTTRKPPGSSKAVVQAGSSADPSSQNSENSPNTTDISTKSATLSKRKRDEAYSTLANKLDHPSQATSTFAVANLDSQNPSGQPCARANSTVPDGLPSQASPSARKSLSQSSLTRKSPVRHLLPSLSESGSNGASDCHSPPPRKKTKCSANSTIVPIEITDNVSRETDSSLSPPAEVPQPNEDHSEKTSPAGLDSAPSDSPRPSRKTRGMRRGCEIQELLQDARQSEILESASSSQLGWLTKTASDILVSRARVTRSSSRRLSSDERLPN